MFHPPVEAFGLRSLREQEGLMGLPDGFGKPRSRRERKPKASTGGCCIPA